MAGLFSVDNKDKRKPHRNKKFFYGVWNTTIICR